MYRGWVLKKLSTIGSLNRRADSMTLVLFNQQKEKEENKLGKDICKLMVLKYCFSLFIHDFGYLQFGSQNDCEDFKKEIEKIVKENK